MDQSPHKSGFVQVNNGISLHYLDWGGEGQVLLFLAGLECNAHIFDRFAPRFTDRYRVLALTRRGHGQSDFPETGYDIDTLVEDIRQFMDCLAIDRVVLVGHSLAGIELSHFSALYPHRVSGLVFLDAAYDRSSPEWKAMWEKDPMRNIQRPGEGADYYTIQDYAAYIKKAYPSLGVVWDEVMDENFLHQVRINPDGKVVETMPAGISRAIYETYSGYAPEDAQIRAPVLNIYAIKDNTYYLSQDFMTKEQQAQLMEFFDTEMQPRNRQNIAQFRRNVPHARVVEIPHAHHYCFIQQEERVYEEMRNFLHNLSF
jgi:non-heme chloroperoxidase